MYFHLDYFDYVDQVMENGHFSNIESSNSWTFRSSLIFASTVFLFLLFFFHTDPNYILLNLSLGISYFLMLLWVILMILIGRTAL